MLLGPEHGLCPPYLLPTIALWWETFLHEVVQQSLTGCGCGTPRCVSEVSAGRGLKRSISPPASASAELVFVLREICRNVPGERPSVAALFPCSHIRTAEVCDAVEAFSRGSNQAKQSAWVFTFLLGLLSPGCPARDSLLLTHTLWKMVLRAGRLERYLTGAVGFTSLRCRCLPCRCLRASPWLPRERYRCVQSVEPGVPLI